MHLLSEISTMTRSLSLATAVTLPSTTAAYAVTALQVFLTSANLLDDPSSSAGYSKFSHEKSVKLPVSGKAAMLLIYVPSVIFLLNHLAPITAGLPPASLFDISNLLEAGKSREGLVASMLLVHFAKRVAETLFLHKYSSKQTDGVMGGTIGVYYTLTCLLITSFSGSVPLSSLSPDMLIIGLAAFTVGELGNLFHHYLLSTLRKSNFTKDKESDEKFDVKSNYLLPKGGLFDFVTMPHYFFELIAWLGIAFVSQDLNVFLVFASMFTYLLTRARATKIWYLKNVDNYPTERKVLVPLLI